MYKEDLTSNNLQLFICYKIQPNQTNSLKISWLRSDECSSLSDISPERNFENQFLTEL